jgi:aminoglycoside phosphotransferase (APT) family kinase protein
MSMPGHGSSPALPAKIERIGDGREAEMLTWGERRVLRLLKDPAHAERLDRERVALWVAGRAGVRVPVVFGEETIDGRPGLIMERIDGPDLLTLLGRQPWLVVRVARMLGETHALIHAATVEDVLPTVHAKIRQLVTKSDLVPERFRRPALERLDTLAAGRSLCHWDFQPANVISSDSGPVVIDWTFAARGDPAADVARTRLILRVGEPSSDASFVMKRLDALGRRLLSTIYLRAYRKKRPVDLALVELWEPLVALARLTAGVPEERERLIELIQSAGCGGR